jgi:ABC-type antimicrobial peptide transport system permease subunit
MLAIGEGSKNSIKAQISSMGTNMLTIRPGRYDGRCTDGYEYHAQPYLR